MSAIERLPKLAEQIEGCDGVARLQELATELARTLCQARPELIGLGPDARLETALRDAREALDGVEDVLPVRWDTRPSMADVVQLRAVVDVPQDLAVLLLGGRP